MIEISVIIPTYNRAQQLRICLDALSSQTQPDADFEVVVVDDGSTDTTSTLLETLKTPYTLRFLKQEHSGQQNARNRGAQAARGRYCLFLDDDIVADPNLVTEHLRVQRQHNGVVAIGQIPIALGATAGRFRAIFSRELARPLRTAEPGNTASVMARLLWR